MGTDRRRPTEENKVLFRGEKMLPKKAEKNEANLELAPSETLSHCQNIKLRGFFSILLVILEHSKV